MTKSVLLGVAFPAPPLSRLLYGSLFLAPLAFTSLCPVMAQSGAEVGWVPQVRPGSGTGPQGSGPPDYDWTGLDAYLYQTDGSYEQYKDYFADGSADVQELDLNGDPNGSGRWTVSGTSTYKWLWTPPGTPQGVHNDPAKTANDPTQPFPTPTLFAFGLIIPYVEAAYDTSAPPLKGSGSVKDGFDSNWNPKFDLLTSSYATAPANSVDTNGYFTNELPRRSILTGTLEGDHVTAHVMLSPSLDVQVSNNGGTGDGFGYGYLEEDNSLISLYYPNPSVRPDLGDFSGGAGESSNQFVYGAQMPSQLSLPAQIGVPEVLYQDDFNWLIKPPMGGGSLVDWRFGTQQATIPDEQPYNLSEQTVNKETLLAPDTMITTAAGSSVPGISFAGLPESNAGFGNYPVTLTVKTYDPASKATTSNDSQTAYIQTFFQGNASNFPGSQGLYTGDPTVQTAPQPYSPPNWYNYYTQVFNIAGKYGVSVHYEAGKGLYQNQSFVADDPANNYPVEINSDAGKINPGFRVFDINPALDPMTETHLARCIGHLSLSGVLSFISVCSHEAGHVVTYITPDDTQPGSTVYRADLHDLSPTWKTYHHLKNNVKNSDTTGVYSGAGDVSSGDAQLTADANGLKELFAYTDSLQGSLPQDWSSDGVNYSGASLPYFVQERYHADSTSLTSGQPPVFYFKFNPLPGVPAYGPGTPVVAADGSYEIRSAADLQALYPSVVIGLEGLTYEAPVTPGS